MKNQDKNQALLVGVGLDNDDGHKRITRGENFVVAGGSEQTHEKMTEISIKVNEKLKRKGKTLTEIEPKEFIDLINEAGGAGQ